MNSKAIKRQLLAAIAMVLVAALALGSSTYAWFANNNQVTANGMSVSAQAEGSLLVISDTLSEGKLTSTETTVGMNLTGSELLPTHLNVNVNDAIIFSGESSSWSHAFSKAFNSAITEGNPETSLTLTEGDGQNSRVVGQYYDSDGKQYFLAGTLYIGLNDKNQNAACGAIKLESFSIEGSSTLKGSARVALVTMGTFSKDGTPKSVPDELSGLRGIIAPDNKTVTSFSSDISNPDSLGNYDKESAPIKVAEKGLSAGEFVKVAVYIYFDGRDDACTSQNFDTTGTRVSLTFESATV